MTTRKPSNEHANLSQEIVRLKQLFETSSVYYQCLDPDGKLLEVNPSWLKLLGYDLKEVQGEWFGNFLSEESRERFSESYSTICIKDDVCNIELTLICKDGSSIYCEFSCSANFDTSNKLTTTYCIFSNITRLRIAEQSLYESEQKYSRLVELSNVGIYELDPHTKRFTYVNDVIKKAFNLEEKDEENFEIESFLSTEEKERYFKRLSKLSSGEEISKKFEYKVNTGKGREIWVQITNSYAKTENNKVRIIGVAQDITERKKMEIELRSYYDRLEQITSNLPSVVFQYTFSNGRTEFLYLSENIKQFVGHSEKEIIENPELLNKMIDPADYAKLVKSIEDSKGDHNPASVRYKILRKDGAMRWVETILSQKLLGDGTELYTGISNDITEKVELREKLQITEKKYESIINSASPGISIMSKQGIVTSVNPRLCEISGYAEEEIIGRSFLKIPAFYKSDLKKYIELYKGALKGILPNEPVSFSWKHKSGEKRWGEAYLSYVKDKGRVIAYQAVLNDITHRELLKKKEAERNKELNFLFESAFTLLSIKDEKSLFEFLADRLSKLLPRSIIALNSISEDYNCLTVESIKFGNKEKYEKIMKLLGNQIVGRKFETSESTFDYAITGRLGIYHTSVYDLTLKQIPEKICSQLEKIIELDTIYEISMGTQNSIFGGCVIIVRKNQEIKHKSIIEMLFREASAAMLRIRAKQKLDMSEQQYKSLSESSGDWIMRFNSSFQQIYLNNAVSKYFNKSKEKLLGKTCDELGYSNEHSRLIEAQIQKTLSTNSPCHCEIKLDIQEKSDFFEWIFYPESSAESSSPDSVLVNVRNVSQRKEGEGKLLEAILRKNKLYSILSHDLRTPFNSILGFLELLTTKYDSYTDEERKNRLLQIDKSAKGAYDLLDSILRWSKDYDSPDSIKPVYFDLRSLIMKSIELSYSSIHEKQISIFNNVSSDILILADYNMISTIVRNILSNAIKFSNPKGHIIISAIERNKEIECKIQDFGIGIRKDELKYVLHKNQRVSISDDAGKSGYGLGLKFCKELITSNKGSIWVESEFKKGTTVYFTIPKHS